MSPRHASRRVPRRTRARATLRTVSLATAAVLVAGLAFQPGAGASTTSSAPAVTGLSVRSGGTWGWDGVTIKGAGFSGTGSRRVSSVLFGTHRADQVRVVDATTISVQSPKVKNRRATVDVRVVLRDGTKSRATSADRFTYVVPTMNTRLNGGWSANQSRSIANSMIGRAARLNAASVAHNPGYWTPAMGRSAVRRAAGWLGMPYTWGGGNATGPTYGSCYGDGLIGKFDCTFRGFDCSGLTLYAWGRYEHLDHYAATQRRQAGRFHPSVAELQPGDLMFWSEGGSTISHVTMYAGGGKVIQASMSGWPVRYGTLAQLQASHSRYFGATRPMSTGKQGSSPTVSSISITHSATHGGATATIHGSHLDTASKVYIGSTGTYSYSIKSSRTITVKLPARAAGTAAVRVYNAWGASALNGRVAITYIAKPAISSITPSSGDTTGGGTVTITGSSFVSGARVYFGSTSATSVRVVSTTQITAVAPGHSAGVAAVRVSTAYGTSNSRGYTFRVPPPPSSTPTTSPTTAAARAK